ncbi:host range and adsorption protein [Cronobacter phage Dev-CD-23823]|uniref:Uncharacterized protein n=1 Tax=Cronobacter phage Dev-CD-23823 TaxID=1712539 RepID=A0A0K8IXN6_9CAUD|nr:host range and adsorption protein [Cronobacter phage Dev-CD-23823]CUH74606.1 hypothetical protein [Cronobacter phage Dev-CD-23823]
MIPIVKFRQAGEAAADTAAMEILTEENYWNPDVRAAFPHFHHYMATVLSCLDVKRCEGYLYTDDGECLAACAFVKSLDIHHGVVAAPITVIVKAEYRGDMTVTRAVSRLTKRVVQTMGCKRYYTVKHLDATTQVHKLRSI